MRIFIIVLIVVALLVILFRSYYERKLPRFSNYKMVSARAHGKTSHLEWSPTMDWPASQEEFDRFKHVFRLIFLTDLHNNALGDVISGCVDGIKKVYPDAILIGGDMMVTKPGKKKDFSVLENLLSEFYGVAPIYYAEGNHELRMRTEPEKYEGWWEEFEELLAAYDVKYLLNETVNIGGNVYLSGLEIEPELYKKILPKKMPDGYMREHLKDMPSKDSVHVVMAHTPKHMENYWKEGADLVLSGHYHGGVIGLPGFRSLISPDFRLFPKYSRGIYTDGKGHGGIVSSGLGTHTINFRLFNRSEMVLINILPTGSPETDDGSGSEVPEKDGSFSFWREDRKYTEISPRG